jgi:glycerol uptake facilitator-like aquaporin
MRILVVDRLGKQRYMLYTAAQLLGACCGAALLRLSLPPSYLETPFVTAGSLTAAHPVQVVLCPQCANGAPQTETQTAVTEMAVLRSLPNCSRRLC